MINATLSESQKNPTNLLIECKSLPRSGHHYLQRVLSSELGEAFSYCEFYNEPGCCKAFPCNAEPYWNHARHKKMPHTRLVKSHDFNLSDPVYTPEAGFARIVLARRPFDFLCSWIELAQLSFNKDILTAHGICATRIQLHHESALLTNAFRVIDEEGATMTPEATIVWLKAKTNYAVAFSEKWLPMCHDWQELGSLLTGTYLVCYEDMGAFSRQLSSELNKEQRISSAGREEIADSQFQPRNGEIAKRKSLLVTELISTLSDEIRESERIILGCWDNHVLADRYRS